MAQTIAMRDVRKDDVVEMEFDDGWSGPMHVLSVGKADGNWRRFTYRPQSESPGPHRLTTHWEPGHVEAPPGSEVTLLERPRMRRR